MSRHTLSARGAASLSVREPLAVVFAPTAAASPHGGRIDAKRRLKPSHRCPTKADASRRSRRQSVTGTLPRLPQRLSQALDRPPRFGLTMCLCGPAPRAFLNRVRWFDSGRGHRSMPFDRNEAPFDCFLNRRRRRCWRPFSASSGSCTTCARRSWSLTTPSLPAAASLHAPEPLRVRQLIREQILERSSL